MSQPLSANGSRPDYWFMDENKEPGVLTVLITVTVIGLVFTLARLFVRAAVHRKPLPDDYVIVFSMLCCIISVIFGVLAVHSGSGRHFDLLTPDQQSKVILWSLCGFIPGIFSVAFPKFAIVYLISRLLCPTRARLVFLWTTTGMAFLLLSGCCIILFSQCTPIRSQWDLSIQGECLDPQILAICYIAASAYSACVDFYLVAYSAANLCKLQLSLKRRLAFGIALVIGFIAGVVAIYKCLRIDSYATPDFLYGESNLLVWTIIESNALIAAASIPVLEPIYDLVRGKKVKKRGPSFTDDAPHLDDEIYGARVMTDVKIVAGYPSRQHFHHTRTGQLGSSLRGLKTALAMNQEQILESEFAEQSDSSSESGVCLQDWPAAGIVKTAEYSVTYERRASWI